MALASTSRKGRFIDSLHNYHKNGYTIINILIKSDFLNYELYYTETLQKL